MINRKIYKKRLIAVFFVALLLGVSGTLLISHRLWAHPSPSSTPVFETPVEDFSYLVWQEGSTYYAKNGGTGVVEYSGTNASQIVQTVVDIAHDMKVGKIAFKGGAYVFDVPLIMTHHVELIGETFVGRDSGVVLKSSSIFPSEPLIKTGISGAWWKIQGFEIDITEGDCTGGIDMTNSAEAEVENVVITGKGYDAQGCTQFGIKISDEKQGLYGSAQYGWLHNLHIFAVRDGIYIHSICEGGGASTQVYAFVIEGFVFNTGRSGVYVELDKNTTDGIKNFIFIRGYMLGLSGVGGGWGASGADIVTTVNYTDGGEGAAWVSLTTIIVGSEGYASKSIESEQIWVKGGVKTKAMDVAWKFRVADPLFQVLWNGILVYNQSGSNVPVSQGASYITITFYETTSYDDYAVLVTPNWDTTVYVTHKTTTTFRVNFGTVAPSNAKIDWFYLIKEWD